MLFGPLPVQSLNAQSSEFFAAHYLSPYPHLVQYLANVTGRTRTVSEVGSPEQIRMVLP
jgi:hypothetical protein